MAATAAFPPGGTYFDTLKKSFVDVKIDKENDNAINTEDFLLAAESLTTLFDVLGSMAFKPVKNDMLGNIKKIRDRLLASPADSTTLQSLVQAELATKKHAATEGLVWLNRGLHFTSLSLRSNLSNPSQELAESFRTGYASTLKPHHSFMVKPIFSAAMSATPYRKDFYAKMGGDQEIVNKELEKWLSALEEQVSILNEFLGRKENKW